MGTKIEWTDEVWNPVTGCTPVSPGCDNCYARRAAYSARLRGRFGYPQDKPFDVIMRPSRLNQPMHWKKPRRVFVCSMGDLFHSDVLDWFIDEVFRIISNCPQHTFQILTKRPDRVVEYANIRELTMPNNVWLGTTIESDEYHSRAWELLKFTARVNYLSFEPLLGEFDLNKYDLLLKNYRKILSLGRYIDWVIIGCESGPGRRPCKLEWVRNIVAQCKAAGVAVFIKQLDINGKVVKDIDKFPADLRLREYPK